jgi:bifunctional N-acetylglucosamine-1-phosphate-uridyltransferase/glucosamine-1-phosphate-acetyltransferase GlmU-like protein
MITAVVDYPQPAHNKFIFRDCDLKFWLAHFYPFCSFLDLPHSTGDFDFLFIFATTIFPACSKNSGRELQRWLKNQDSKKPWLYTPENMPFFIASKAFFSKQNSNLKPGIFRWLKAKEKIKSLPLKNTIPVFNPETEPRKIESAVIDLQISHLHKNGVQIEDYGHFFMAGLVPIGKNTMIGSGVIIKGESRIGKNVQIYPNCFIENSHIGDQCIILPGSIIRDSIIEKNVQLGPYCHLRNGSLVKKGAKIGNFVEMKKSVLGQGSKAMHLTYIGDALVGKKVNIGAGTITCNYDGVKKNPTIIENNVFIGSGTELVAPVTVHRHSYVGAGSTITEDVPQNALAIARQRQTNISGWVLRKKKK